MTEHFDVVVVGAGLSGIGAGYHLQKNSPDRSYVILEGRERLGGTWDLFRYPGIRSDSDMYTLGFSFKPWTNAKAIADGPSILSYLEETAAENGIDKHIRYRTCVKSAAWSTADAAWDVVAESEGREVRFTCNFLFMCTGYYNYARAYTPEFEGVDDFRGRIVHPQFWTGDIDYKDKKVVVIGSGATAVTLVPEMAREATSVTMLQRSPTYVVSRPSQDGIANGLRKFLPAMTAYGITRWKNVLLQQFFFRLARNKPDKVKERMIQMVRDELGPDYDVGTHFTPSYNPWDQRVCLVPDADLFQSIREGRSHVVTGHIDRFVPEGIRLQSGEVLEADLIVTATGLELQLISDIQLSVDGAAVDLSKATTYKGMMLSDVPNVALSFGYTNASWTLKADLTCEYMCRLLNAMKKRGMRQVTPRLAAPVGEVPFLDFTSGYVQRAMEKFPRQGTRKPWKLNQNYSRDLMALRYGSIDTEMEFSNPVPAKARAA
ncbi:NAD(P)/FAD-dependent oxidoreductase [Sphingomonas sp. G-3-2-10]|uniref:flavin-containing monooxygenase n=1 Tax=Sphingomonas sp. G-3-2-10 TaxID=2728838 RepID=UPI00146E9A89|nr:NAD(P)/FAD-dependent oxidoreductase [Sphingomonas sp. G-3-2-10]NML05396.1 NAD(P)/FAD-dependent oxidoreductase [Sphingomonas sp. G-3-2-10]